jgi:hypothetical protein
MGFTAFLVALGLGSAALVIVSLGALTAAALAISSALTHNSELFRLVRVVFLDAGTPSWALAGLVVLGVIVCLSLWGSCLPWLLIACAACLAGAFHVFLDRPLAAERGKILEDIRGMLRRLRARGHDEETLRELFAGQDGAHGGELVEAIFGHRAAIAARTRRDRAGRAQGRPLAFSWRDSLFSALEKRLQERRERRHLRILQDAEEGRLEARGINLLTARRRARRIAKAMILTAAEWRDEQRLLESGDHPTTLGGPRLLERLKRAAEQPEAVLEPHEAQPGTLRRWADTLAGRLLGRRLRFLLGAALLALCAAWLDAAGIITARGVRDKVSEVTRVARKAIDSSDPGVLREVRWNIALDWKRLEEPVGLGWLPDGTSGGIHGSNLGLAGSILILSTMFGRRVVGFMALVGSALILLWPRAGVTIPWVSSHLDPHAQARALGILVSLAGPLFPRRRSVS